MRRAVCAAWRCVASRGIVRRVAQELFAGLGAYLGADGVELLVDWREPGTAAAPVAAAAAAGAAGSGRSAADAGTRGGGRGGGGSRRAAPRQRDPTHVSKTLSWALRHGARELGLAMGADGYVRLADLLRVLRPQIGDLTERDVCAVVASDAKQRYTMSTDGSGAQLIRAAQGHTLAAVRDEELLTPLAGAEEAGDCVHGTYLDAWRSISRTGLSCMARRHIHFAPRDAGGVISGMRGNAEVKIFVDVGAAMAAGIKFFRSDNGVILSPGDAAGMIPARFFTRVVRVSDGASLLAAGADAAAAAAAAAAATASGGGGGGGGVSEVAADELRELVTRFAADSKLSVLPLPPSLSRAERQIVHAAAEALGLAHSSSAVGSARTLVLRKR
jgi:2'-phosphotransferase